MPFAVGSMARVDYRLSECAPTLVITPASALLKFAERSIVPGRGSDTVEFTFTYDPGHSPLKKVERFQVTGQVRKALSVQAELYMGSHSELSSRIPAITLNVAAHTKLQSLSAKCDRTDLIVSGSESTKEFEVAMKSVPALGPIESSIQFDGVAADGAKLPPTRVRVHGEIVQDVQFEPRELIAGSRATGGTYDTSCTIRSLVGNAVRIHSVSAEGEGLTVVSWSPENPDVKLRQRVLKAGQQTTILRAVVESKSRMYTVVVPVTCFGVDGLGE